MNIGEATAYRCCPCGLSTISLSTFYSKHNAASKAVFFKKKKKSDYVNSWLKNLYCSKDKSLTHYFGSQSGSSLFLPLHLLLFHLPCTLYSSNTYVLTTLQKNSRSLLMRFPLTGILFLINFSA